MRCYACFDVVEIGRMILRINVSLTCTMSIYDKCKDAPPRIIELLLLYPASIALSNDLMVSSGRSKRGRVGLERSGSAGEL